MSRVATPDAAGERTGMRVHVKGVVQGVGFRPFVFGLARRHGLAGWVRNSSAGVDIAVDGEPASLDRFLEALRAEAPPLAAIDVLEVSRCPRHGFAAFEIVPSAPVAGAYQPVSPDVGTCDNCLRELFDPGDRRYRYPFINCTHCGPRYTIIVDMPYDRPQTTMAPFAMCPDCAREYGDPLDRRFHAQPVACPACGPHVWLAMPHRPAPLAEADAAVRQTQAALRAGKIVAVKGLGGFHLACDAGNPDAIRRLRARKRRSDRPFAVMMPDVATVQRFCLVAPAEAALLRARERPIVLLDRLPGSTLAADCAPGLDTLGVMLPYTPLHHLLFAAGGDGQGPWAFAALVMTSGNVSEEPIAFRDAEALRDLAGIADLFLLHNREIHARCDDAVVRAAPNDRPASVYALRRARGYAPRPIRLAEDGPALLATGAHFKNAFCLTRGRDAFLSPHVGDLENFETLRAFEAAVAHCERLFRVHPVAIAHDMHPDYLATRYAQDRAARDGLPAFAVQHHHAHIAAAMAEHRLPPEEPVIGIAFDGTGYGLDGAVWGGEFLIGDVGHFERALHLTYVPLPGGDQAARYPWRMALSWLRHAGIPWSPDLAPVQAARPDELAVSDRWLQSDDATLKAMAPLTSSMGRLFDAIAALSGGRQAVTYEAQAAVELEALARAGPVAAPYPFAFSGPTVDAAPLIQAAVADIRAGAGTPLIAARFHHGVAHMVREACSRLRAAHGLRRVVLSGGVWQNTWLLGLTLPLLSDDGFAVTIHEAVPANDGGLALGQATVARYRMERT